MYFAKYVVHILSSFQLTFCQTALLRSVTVSGVSYGVPVCVLTVFSLSSEIVSHKPLALLTHGWVRSPSPPSKGPNDCA